MSEIFGAGDLSTLLEGFCFSRVSLFAFLKAPFDGRLKKKKKKKNSYWGFGTKKTSSFLLQSCLDFILLITNDTNLHLYPFHLTSFSIYLPPLFPPGAPWGYEKSQGGVSLCTERGAGPSLAHPTHAHARTHAQRAAATRVHRPARVRARA